MFFRFELAIRKRKNKSAAIEIVTQNDFFSSLTYYLENGKIKV